jgi:hypothetical protein
LSRDPRIFEVLTNSNLLIHEIKDDVEISQDKIVISNLKEGTYFLYFSAEISKIEITVSKGTLWNDDGHSVVTQKKIMTCKSQTTPLLIKNKKIGESNVNGKADIQIQIHTHDPISTRVHILAS